jgi:hypothetical protein
VSHFIDRFRIEPDVPSQELLGIVGKSDQRPDLKFPLSAGQKWNYALVTRSASFRRRVQRRRAEVNVAGIEQVTTPAGSFKAYKLIRSESWFRTNLFKGSSERIDTTTTYFYSPETRSIVKSFSVYFNNPGTVETELIKFTPGN